MGERALYRADGSVLLRVGALEQLLRYSMNSNRASSVLSSIHDFKLKETELTGGKQWTTTFLRKQFFEKDLEELYRRYDNKLRETLISIYISLLIIFSTIHIVLVIVSTHTQEVQWHSTYISMAMYILRISIPALCLYKSIYNPLKIKFIWIPILVTFIVTVALVVTDIAVAIYSSLEGMSLRPAYATMSLLSVYIFLPMRNNFLAIILGILVSLAYALIFAFVTYIEDPQMGVLVSSDVIYLAGVNIMGIYFRLMNEIVTRRSFLDRRACVESTLSLNFAKEQEERLMLSILPEHIVSKVRQDIRAIFMSLQSHSLTMTMRAFNQLYVAEHDNVSILYADVVNYTKISTTLSPLRMVELLNELFGRFDEASEEHDVLRIKFLGDCYYCVSGVPIPCEQHAKNCVDLGLEMIHIIKDVREKRFLDIDMRIGVHSGRVLCGLIGMRKWQFDIWSKDVTIANKMESTGKSGKVHITKQTLELLLDYAREYIIEPNFESQNHSFITEHKLETYLLSRPARPHTEYKPFKRAPVGISKIMKRTSAVSNHLRYKTYLLPKLITWEDKNWFHCMGFVDCRRGYDNRTKRSEGRHSSNFRRMTTFMDVNLVEYQRMLKEANAQMAKEIEDISSGKDFFKKEAQLNRFTLMFKDLKLEKSFIELPDPLFKYYILCCFIILSLILLINGLTTKWFRGFPWYTWAIFAMLLVGLLILQPLTWFQFFWTIYKGPYEEPRNTHLRKIYDISIDIIRSAKIRTLIYLLISVGLAGTSVVNVVGCTEDPVGPEYETVLSNCVSSWHVTQCWGLALLLNFLFTRVFFIFKWIVATVMTVFYLVVVWKIKTSLFVEDATWNVGLDPRVSHTLSIVFITITLYWIDRTTEYRNRLDHMWQIQLSEEQVEAETMLKVNNMLLENILPAHVVKIYLDLNRSIDDLYFEEYKNVAVMFASLTDYKLGVEDDAELSDKFILSLMDEVISDFDRLLLTGSSAHKVEKIKMAGWTYMAACGLDLNKRESDDSSTHSGVADLRLNTPYNKAIVLTMVEFAAAMMMQLQSFNRGSFQSFEGLNLRIGISHGEVAAGVIGSLKPLYDIWGNAVNMASRMDSTGETGKIQVTENTAIILDECGILTTNRGETFVKGAGYIKTYFVPLDEDFKLIKKENSIDFYRTEDRNRYFNVKNQLSDIRVSVDSPADIKRTLSSYINTEHYDSDDVSQYSSYVARDLSIDFDGDDEMWTDDDFNYDNSEQTRTVTPSSHESSDYTLSEIEGENTKV